MLAVADAVSYAAGEERASAAAEDQHEGAEELGRKFLEHRYPHKSRRSGRFFDSGGLPAGAILDKNVIFLQCGPGDLASCILQGAWPKRRSNSRLSGLAPVMYNVPILPGW